MLRTLKSELDLARLKPCDEELVIAFVPTNRDIYRVLQACHTLKTVYVHPDTFKEMPCVGQTLLYMQKVKLVVDANVSKKNSPQQEDDTPQDKEEEAPAQTHIARLVMIAR
jgi:hypothetical protein